MREMGRVSNNGGAAVRRCLSCRILFAFVCVWEERRTRESFFFFFFFGHHFFSPS